MIRSGIVISESLLERGRCLGKPPPQFSLGMDDWEESDEDEMDALLFKAAELADFEPTAESSDDDIDKIPLQASHQFDPDSPPTAKRQKVDPEESV